jgi:hypothetical protein
LREERRKKYPAFTIRMKSFYRLRAWGSFFTGLSWKQRDGADHSQHAGTGIPDLVKLTRHEQDCIASANFAFGVRPGPENAFSIKDIEFVLLLVIVE